MLSNLALLAQAAAPPADDSIDLVVLANLGIAVAILALSIAGGLMAAKALRMPDFGWKIGLVIFSLVASAVVTVKGWPPKLGIDLSGGVILVYEVDQDKKEKKNEAVDMDQMIGAVSKRVNPSGTKEIIIRKYGVEQIEIIIPNVSDEEADRIKKTITAIGSLEFLIVANTSDRRHDELIALAKTKADALAVKEIKSPDGKRPLGRWVPVANKPDVIASFRQPDFVTRDLGKDAKGNERLEVVVVEMPEKNKVTGEFLTQAAVGEQNGKPCVEFAFDSRGAARFGILTGNNLPRKETNQESQLAIILDGFLHSAPNIKDIITDRGVITGSFTLDEVKSLVDVLHAGALPTALRKEPSTQLSTEATLGEDTIRQAKIATVASMIVVVSFMIFYYRLAGVVASFALLINLLLTVALMILIKAAFTLTGVAGLALTLGMSVDANVLIYERMREEFAKGATLRMAIRNGFSRATTTIIDSNLTTLITAVVLYVMGTDQIRGFAVTLIIGLVSSLFTAIFVSRVVLDILDKQRWITKLKMMQFVGFTKIDFIGAWRVCVAASVALIVLGLLAVGYRGKGLLDIDFVGGTQVQVRFKDEQNIGEIRKSLDSLPETVRLAAEEQIRIHQSADIRRDLEQELGKAADPQVLSQRVEQRIKELSDLPDHTVNEVNLPGENNIRFNINTSNPSIAAVESIIRELFKGKLAHNTVKYGSLAMVRAGAATEKPATDSASGPAAAPNPPSPDPAAPNPAAPNPAAPGATVPNTPAANTPKPNADGQPPEQPKGDAKATPEANQESSVSTPLEEQLVTRGEDLCNQETAQNPAAPSAPAQEKPAETAKDDKPVEKTADKPVEKTAEKSDTAAEKPATAPAASPTTSLDDEVFIGGVKTRLTFTEPIRHDELDAKVRKAMDSAKLPAPFRLSNPDHSEGARTPFATWEITLALASSDAERVLTAVQQDLETAPDFPSSSNIGGKVASATRLTAIGALLASLVLIVAYIWVRFEKVVFGLAAVVALIHDVLITLGFVAFSYWLAPILGFMQVDVFKVDLNIVAALLTIIGYSLNDTIVVFDRIREVRGKSPNITKDMLNLSINQTLSRTLLTGLTTMFVLVILYFWGGQGIHGFAYCLFVGMIVGTFSSVYVASPILLWLMSSSQSQSPEPVAKKQAARVA